MKNIIIIGSGIAGLSAANYLSSKNFNVTVLDKGKYPGGRISTRRGKDFIFNHGAQFFTAKSNEFKKIDKDIIKISGSSSIDFQSRMIEKPESN